MATGEGSSADYGYSQRNDMARERSSDRDAGRPRKNHARAHLGNARAVVAGAASVALATAGVLFFLLGPTYASTSEQCSGSGACHTSSATYPGSWSTILLVPLVSSLLVAGGTLLGRRKQISRGMEAFGCLGLGVITVLGAVSIGILFLPADAAAVAVLLMRSSAIP